MSKFVNNPLWEELQSFIENTYQTKAMLNYSRCSGRRGWNLKYRKSGKSLCVLDPMDGYFFALVVSAREKGRQAVHFSICIKSVCPTTMI